MPPAAVILPGMPRAARIAPGGMIFHCLNRGNDRRQIFDDDGDFAGFERVLQATLEVVPVRSLSYCLMPNHWHLVLWPRNDGELGAFMQRLTTTHVRRWHRHRHSDGRGHLYQGTYKSFPVQDDRHFLVMSRYVERNALRAALVERGTMAMVKSVAAGERLARRARNPERVACGATGKLAEMGQRGADRKGAGGDPRVAATWPSLWR